MTGSNGEGVTSIDLENRHPRGSLLGRFIVFGLVIALVFSVLAARLFYLQVDQGSYYTGLSDSNRIVSQEIPSTRGLIYDRNGTALVSNVPTYAVQVLSANLPLTQRPAVVAQLSSLLGLTTSAINQTIDKDPGARFDEVTIATGVPEDVARVISEQHLEMPGVSVVVQSQRDYLYGPLVSQVVGYTGAVTTADLQRLATQGYLSDDQIGKAGVEAEYEAALRGQYGSEQDERDALGQDLGVLSQTQDPVPGSSLDLTIDLKTQQQAQTALEWGLNTAHVKSGVVIAMDPQTGQILAMVSLPTYDDNAFAQGISDAQFQAYLKNPNQPLLNHAIAEQYAPGSTYKLVTGTGAPGRQEDHRADADPDRPLPATRRRTSTPTGTTGASATSISTTGSATPATRSSTRWPACWGPIGSGYWAVAVRLRGPHGRRPAGRGGRHRADQRLEAGGLRPERLPRRGLPGRHRAGL